VKPAPVVVWTVWAAMLLVALVAIAKDGPTIPRAEDWLLVPALTGHEPSLAAWLWEQNSEHRIPVPQLAYLGVLRLGGGDFRSGMVFNTISLGLLAGALILAARSLRGSAAWADIVFPLALLHLGHWHNLIWGWQIQFVLSTLFGSALLLVMVTRGTQLGPGTAALAAACLVLLPLSGANGLALAPALAAWVGASGVLAWRRTPTGGRGTGAVLTAAVAATVGVTLVHALTYEQAPWYPASPGLGATLATSAKFAAMAVGPAAATSWPISVLGVSIVASATLALLAKSLGQGEARDRQRAAALLIFLAALGTLALAVGWGRAGRVAAVGLNSRYALLAVPLLFVTYFAWELYGPRGWRGRVRTALALVMLALLPLNTSQGLAARDWVRAGMAAVERDIAAGLPGSLLADRHHPFLLHWDRHRLAAGIDMLRRANLGPFARTKEAPVREIELPLAPDPVRATAEASIRASTGTILRSFDLGGARRVFAVRLRSSHPALEVLEGAQARVSWSAGGAARAAEARDTFRQDAGSAGPARTATIWINDVIDRFDVRLDRPDLLTGLRITVVVGEP
jgi:hypothetical protein